MKEKIINIFRNVYENQLTMDITAANVHVLFMDLAQQGLIILAPIFHPCCFIAFIGNYAQIGFMFIGDPLMMKFNKINPIEGFKRIFSAANSHGFSEVHNEDVDYRLCSVYDIDG